MSAVKVAGVAAATWFLSVGVFAQSNSQTSSTEASIHDTSNMTTVVGCLVKESDYRETHGLHHRAGLHDEYVIVESADCSNTASGAAYRPTGSQERDMGSMLGQRVSVTGKLEHGRQARAGSRVPPEIKVSSFSAAPVPVAPQQALIAPAAEPFVEAPASPEPAPAATSGETTPQPIATSGQLPKTAGEEPLIGLIGLIALSAGIGLKLLRRAIA